MNNRLIVWSIMEINFSEFDSGVGLVYSNMSRNNWYFHSVLFKCVADFNDHRSET